MEFLAAMRRTPVAAAVASALFSLAAGQALGAGFALQEQNAADSVTPTPAAPPPPRM